MSQQKYLLLYRDRAEAFGYQPTPEEMQAQFAQWNAWKERFTEEVLDFGDGLLPTGKVIKGDAVTDGPFIEAKEMMGGYSIIQAASWERAVEVAKACPILLEATASIEIRPLAGY